jgi:hypothetical protein
MPEEREPSIKFTKGSSDSVPVTKSCVVETVQDYLLIGPRKYNIFATQLRSTCSSLLL